MKELVSLGSHASPVRRLQFAAFGGAFELRGNNDSSLARIAARATTLGWTLNGGDDVDAGYDLRTRMQAGCPHHELHCDDELVYGTSDLDQLLEAFENHAKISTAVHARERVFVHAGVVGWRDYALVMPGRSHSGKTSLVRALVAAGARYYSDEFAVIDRFGMVHPYAVPLSIRPANASAAVRTPIEAIGGRAGRSPLPVRLIVATTHRRHAKWSPRPMAPGAALLTLLDNTVAARQHSETAMRILGPVASQARAVASTRGDVRRVVPSLLRLLDAYR